MNLSMARKTRLVLKILDFFKRNFSFDHFIILHVLCAYLLTELNCNEIQGANGLGLGDEQKHQKKFNQKKFSSQPNNAIQSNPQAQF